MEKLFICHMCGYVGKCGPEEEAEAELKVEFGDVDKEDCKVVCDGCWETVKPKNNCTYVELCTCIITKG